MFEKIGKANRDVIAEGVERLRVVYEQFINEKRSQGYDFKYTDGQMIGHNFYKLILYDIASKSGCDPRAMMQVAIDTLKHALERNITNETDVDLS